MAPHSRTLQNRPADMDIASARDVLKTEAEGLIALADSLDGDFAQALELLAQAQGRIIVTGMGKSGHIGRKIAATLASTGTPAFFVHPAEASHGDLGMVTRQDAVIALSNSGETSELGDIIAYTRRFGIAMISITSREYSTLAQAADVSLVLPAAREACPLGLAPTTSTTLTLALGDAIAVALLERRGFSASDFREFHPGGSLGNKLLKVSDLMHGVDNLPTIAQGQPVSAALLEMTAKHFGCVGVIDENRALLGIITDGDLRRHMGSDLLAQSVDAIMTANPQTIGPNTLAVEALAVMNGKSITSLFVIEDGSVHGILHIHDCLRAGIA